MTLRCKIIGHRWTEQPGQMMSVLEDERGLVTVARMPSRVCTRCKACEFVGAIGQTREARSA